MSERVNPNTFAVNPLDRAAERRTDALWLKERMRDPASLIVPFWKSKPFVVKAGGAADIGWLRPGLFDAALADDPVLVFLGLEKGNAHFAVDISASPDPEHAGPLAGLGSFEELRTIAADLHPADASILAQGKSLIDWHQRHGHCAVCGTRTIVKNAGYSRSCPNCEAEHFPRTDPVVITLAISGERCLLGRGASWPAKYYSALAGYLEPGETIEAAAARELWEETRVKVGDVRIFSNQPWPYPSSLMIGCFAEAETTEITVDGVEIVEAEWFDRETIFAALKGDTSVMRVPPPLAIAHQLLKAWVAGRD